MKKILVISLVPIAAVLLGVGIFIYKKNQPVPILPKPLPQQVLRLVSFTPGGNSIDVPEDQVIEFQFNKVISLNDITIILSPTTPFTALAAEKKLTLKPKEALLSGGYYTMSIASKKDNRVFGPFHFIVRGQGVGKPVSDLDPDLLKSTQAFDLENHPDIFLANNIPYKGAFFSITDYKFTTIPFPHNFFIVHIKGVESAAKKSLVTWLKSLGLTETHIQTLDLRYETD